MRFINEDWGLRDYSEKAVTTWADDWEGQLGLEPDFNQYISKLISIFEKLKPKIKESGTMWINLADSYYGSGNAEGHTAETTQFSRSTFEYGAVRKSVSMGKQLRRKTQVGIPERFKIAMIDNDWICRSTIIWHKLSVMPQPHKDRFTTDFEYFYFFSKNPMHYFEQQFEPIKSASLKRAEYGFNALPQGWKEENSPIKGGKITNINMNEKGRNARTIWKIKEEIPSIFKYLEKYHNDVLSEFLEQNTNAKTFWNISSKGFKGKHYASYPEKLIEVPIQSSCPPGGTVLDIFLGSGTTAVVAENLDRNWIGIEINSEYVQIAKARIEENRIRLNKLKLIKLQQNRI